MKPNVHFWSYLAHFFVGWYASDKSYRESQNTPFVFSNILSPPLKSYRLWDNVEKYCRAR